MNEFELFVLMFVGACVGSWAMARLMNRRVRKRQARAAFNAERAVPNSAAQWLPRDRDDDDERMRLEREEALEAERRRRRYDMATDDDAFMRSVLFTSQAQAQSSEPQPPAFQAFNEGRSGGAGGGVTHDAHAWTQPTSPVWSFDQPAAAPEPPATSCDPEPSQSYEPSSYSDSTPSCDTSSPDTSYSGVD